MNINDKMEADILLRFLWVKLINIFKNISNEILIFFI